MDLTDDPAVAVLLTYSKEIKKTCILKNLYIETCKLSHVKQIASPGYMHDTGCWGLVHWDDPDGRDGEGGRWGVFRMGNTCTPGVDSSQCMAKPIQYCKVK